VTRETGVRLLALGGIPGKPYSPPQMSMPSDA
jgi:hypothetical protein